MDCLQKLKINWAVEGDENTKFFHGLLKRNRKQKAIRGVMVNGVWLKDPPSVKEAFFNFFQDQFQYQNNINLERSAWFKSISEAQAVELELMPNEDEIKVAVWACGGDKAPGPDGFSFVFIKRFWGLLKDDVVGCVMEFFQKKVIVKGCNSSFITLIPKVLNPMFIKDYRPISLIGVQYNIIAKLMANRLAKVIDDVISYEQSTFITGRQILDSVMMVNEVVHWAKSKKRT